MRTHCASKSRDSVAGFRRARAAGCERNPECSGGIATDHRLRIYPARQVAGPRDDDGRSVYRLMRFLDLLRGLPLECWIGEI